MTSHTKSTYQQHDGRSVHGSRFKALGTRVPLNLQPRTVNARHVDRCSKGLLDQAKRYLVGGVNSPVRAFRHTGGEPLLLRRATGAEVIDEAHRSWLDFIMGWGALVLGHNPPAVVRDVRRSLAQGLPLGLTHAAEVELARLITEEVPSVEQVRFTVSGTEACMTAVRLARAQTGRSMLVVCEGCYHGHGDALMAGQTSGIPPVVAQQTLTVPFNDIAALDALLKRHGQQTACVIVEPVAANMGVIPPAPGYLRHLREATSRYGIVLIFDEVVTGFRLGLGGAQERFGVRPDLTTFGKILGGGFPIGAVGGPRRLMQRLAPEGDVYHGGTFAGHPLSMIGGIAVVNAIKNDSPYARLERLAARLASGLAQGAVACGVPLQVNRAGSMMTVFFADSPITNFAQARATDRNRFARWANGLRDRGVLVPPSPFEALFISSAHTERHIERCLEASRRVLKAL
ncbi:MAG: glutamate-1-semialdehyde 2,1-aminomutase [Candidatus Omnitrophica bacterium]|nr:glutamate-1-semialdehyde 2,1-aminomutase [Candidatus Omnitrophota bacterium]